MTRALVIKTYGDEQISNAIVTGITKPAETEAEKQRRIAGLVRVAVGNDKTADDYAKMLRSARREYGRMAKRRPVNEAVWGIIGGCVLAVDYCYRRLRAINRER